MWTAALRLPTYLPADPDRNPMFLERRVYQGSSGRVYPLPFTDRIAESRVERRWQAVWIENEYLRVLILPELGGRVHAVQDRTNGYDLIYRQPVIKPALVGLAGPWISGGIEFNWPQHHRPATFLPVEVAIEREGDGSRTVWCGDHDPLTRMKGMHGIRLRPGSARLELRVRVSNRTSLVQTFLWWANVATRVHEAYQSFFPPDVRQVADHAKRATSSFPLAEGWYYGVDYGRRGRRGVPPEEQPARYRPGSASGADRVSTRSGEGAPGYAPNDLSWYANIPTPCSYMCVGSRGDFFGGYDHRARAGLVHVADHRIAPGKKQWTWGNHEFGYAWDRHLTDPTPDGEYPPYIELMAGVFTDNQPDFSFLGPGETRTWNQYWYPIREMGPVHHANLEAAVRLDLSTRRYRIGVNVTARHPGAVIRLEGRQGLAEWVTDLAPERPFVLEAPQPRVRWRMGGTTLRVVDRNGRELIAFTPQFPSVGEPVVAATEPPPPEAVASADELFITGLHLEQYRHATRCPTAYWREALRRDPLDSRCNQGLGIWHLRRGEWGDAERCLRRTVARQTLWNPNPYEGEAHYALGVCLRHQGREDEAAEAFHKATWNQAWQSAAHLALAEIACARGEWTVALEHLERSTRAHGGNSGARNLRALVLRRLGRCAEARAQLRETLAQDPLDPWARWQLGRQPRLDAQTRLDLAHDLARAGQDEEARAVLQDWSWRRGDLPDQNWGAEPMVHYTLGWLHARSGDQPAALESYRRGATAPADYCFPARLEDIAVLEAASRANPRDARAPYYLGNLLYDRRRHREAIRLWERSARLDPDFATVWRNLGIGFFNILDRPERARLAYERAFRAAPDDARVLYERDQLWKRLRISPGRRLRALESRLDLVGRRDDLTVELCALYNRTGRSAEARTRLAERRFQPWEGGEGQALEQHVRTHLILGRIALAEGRPSEARRYFEQALSAPENLGEARHLLANPSDIHYWLGRALADGGDPGGAREHWRRAARLTGDFQEMSVRAFSEMTYYSALAWRALGCEGRARRLLKDLLRYADGLLRTPARLDYFATSLPTLLLFEDDLQMRQDARARFLQAQAWLGLGQRARATGLLSNLLKRDPGHGPAADLVVEAGLGMSPKTRRTRRTPS